MRLFPAGTVSAATNLGTINGIKYKIFEPNLTCRSQSIHTILTTQFQDQIMLTRKKALPYLTITYEYENIFDREFRQIHSFIDDVDEALTSFHVADFSKGYEPDNVASSANKWTINISNTTDFSATLSKKSNYVLVWSGKSKFKLGQVTDVSQNTSIVASPLYGGLPPSETSGVLIYPVYECYNSVGALSNWRSGVYVDESIGEDGGYVRSGILTFISKYKIK